MGKWSLLTSFLYIGSYFVPAALVNVGVCWGWHAAWVAGPPSWVAYISTGDLAGVGISEIRAVAGWLPNLCFVGGIGALWVSRGQVAAITASCAGIIGFVLGLLWLFEDDVIRELLVGYYLWLSSLLLLGILGSYSAVRNSWARFPSGAGKGHIMN